MKVHTRFFGLAAGAALALSVVACGEEGPTEIGGGLIPGGAVRTIEVHIDANRYLVWDTAFSGYILPPRTGYAIVANQFDGRLNANALLGFGAAPASITVRDTAGVTRTDTVPRITGGRLLVVVDSLRTIGASPATYQLHHITEAWDPLSATWTMRSDTAGARFAWSQPGGTRSAAVSVAEWTVGQDTLVFPLDSLAIRALTDTLTGARGALLAATTPGAHLRVASVGLEIHLEAGSFAADTTVVVTNVSIGTTFVFDPPVAQTVSNIRVGGVPAWRGFLRLRERLDTLQIPCPGGAPGCTIPLSSTTITQASLLLERQPSPPGFVTEDSMRIVSQQVLPTAQVPLLRSPLGQALGVSTQALLPRIETGTVEVPITDLLRALVEPRAEGVTRPEPVVALRQLVEGGTFGFASFAPGPRLRLVLTVASEVQLR